MTLISISWSWLDDSHPFCTICVIIVGWVHSDQGDFSCQRVMDISCYYNWFGYFCPAAQWISRWYVLYSTRFLSYPSTSTKLKGGYTGFTLSVCPSVDRIVSALYLQQYLSDPFHICTSYQASWEGVSHVMFVSKFKKKMKFWRILYICNFDFVFFCLGIQHDSIVWVIMRRRWVSSECRRSSCSSFRQIVLTNLWLHFCQK